MIATIVRQESDANLRRALSSVKESLSVRFCAVPDSRGMPTSPSAASAADQQSGHQNERSRAALNEHSRRLKCSDESF